MQEYLFPNDESKLHLLEAKVLLEDYCLSKKRKLYSVGLKNVVDPEIQKSVALLKTLKARQNELVHTSKIKLVAK